MVLNLETSFCNLFICLKNQPISSSLLNVPFSSISFKRLSVLSNCLLYSDINLSYLITTSSIFSTFQIYKLAYSYGKILSNRVLSISINSNALFFESISEKTLFNLITSENTMLIKGSIFSLVTLPMQLTIIISLLSLIFRYSSYLIFVLPLFGITYLIISNLVFKSTTIKGEKIFNLRSSQTDLLSRIIDNYSI